MIRIAYIELDTHAEIAANFRELLTDQAELTVDFYFSEKILRILNLAPSETIFRSTAERLFAQLSAKAYDLIIIGTAHRNFNVFRKIVERFPTAVLVHNKNFSNLSIYQLVSRVFKDDQVYRAKLLLKEGLLSMPEVYRHAQRLLVLEPSMADDHHTYLPLLYSKYNEQPDGGTRLKIVVPGAVTQKRRDYRHILKTLQKINVPLELIFAGRAAGAELVWLETGIRPLKKDITVQFFSEKIPQREFEALMKSAHFLWCPVQRETDFFSTSEIYGETKMSGNVGDAIKFSKFALFPAHYPSFCPLVIHEQKDVERQFREILQMRSANSDVYSRANVQNELISLLKAIVAKT